MCTHAHMHTIHYLPLSKHNLDLHTPTCMSTHLKNPFDLFEQKKQSYEWSGSRLSGRPARVFVGLHLGRV